MIDARELRIGNFVNTHRHDYAPSLEVVKSIDELGINYSSIHGHDGVFSDPINDDFTVAPIPLTAERLEEFGIPKVNGCYAAVYGLWFNKSLTGWNIENDIHPPFPKYVHTFQNLYLALTGEELKRET